MLAFAAGGSGNLNLTFQFSGINPTLGDLFAGNVGTTSTSFSGAISTIAAVPETHHHRFVAVFVKSPLREPLASHSSVSVK